MGNVRLTPLPLPRISFAPSTEAPWVTDFANE